jgi:aspartate racemase
MKTPGIIGGLGPESTVDYYRAIIAAYRAKIQDGSYPPLIIHSLDLHQVRADIEANRLSRVIEYLLAALHGLAHGGADFGIIAANTPHLVFADLAPRSPLPLISIVEVACQEVVRQGLIRPALLGTRFTMQGRFYPDVFHRAGKHLVVPSEIEQDYIHDVYLNELVNGVFRPETAVALVSIIQRLQAEEGIDSVILGGTELPLLLRGHEMEKVIFLDTTKLHVERLVEEMLSDSLPRPRQ